MELDTMYDLLRNLLEASFEAQCVFSSLIEIHFEMHLC